MSNSTEEIGSTERKQGGATVPPAEVRRTLSAVLQGAPFRTSPQTQKLLQFLVTEALAGRAETLKERNIGAHVFGRRPGYDTSDDPIVRLRVGEVRKRLALYYQSTREEPVRISIPSGSFRPSFEWTGDLPGHSVAEGQPAAGSIPPAVEPVPHPVLRMPSMPPPVRRPFSKWWFAAVALLALLALAVAHFIPSPEERAMNRFWGPVLDDSHSVLIHIGNNAVYELNPAYQAEYLAQHPDDPDAALGFSNYFPIPPETKIPIEDLTPARNVYHTNGDVTALLDIASLLVRRNRPFDLRYGGDVTYDDLRESPTILIGAHNNYWTMSLTRNYRFAFEGPDAIVDHSDPKRRWAADANRNQDYAIVSRVLNSSNGRALISIAGVGHGGTFAAARFVTSPRSIAALAKSLPRGWEKKNLQVVLHTSVKNQVPTSPEVVATCSW
ncbi:MAG TPA: hypothetical protein VII58_11510 [Acidobacteriaceae bacterium]